MTFGATFGRVISPTFQPKSSGEDVAKFYCTTTGAATLTIAALTVSAAVVVDWGDGSTNSYTGSGERTHAYSGAGTFTVKISNPLNVIALTLSDNKVTLNSADIKNMLNITDAMFYTLKAGTFDSADIVDWRPATFYLYSMPAGYAGTFDSADISAWRPTYFRLYSMPAGYAITITPSGFSGWITTTIMNISDNALSQAQVDTILSDFWAGFATRTASGGTINVGGSNSAPSGILQAANPPTTGKEFAYELKNDSQNINPTKKWATVTITA